MSRNVDASESLLHQRQQVLPQNKEHQKDIVLVSELDGERFHCHSKILASKIPTFRQFFGKINFMAGLRPQVIPLEVRAEELQPLLDFCYTGKMSLPDVRKEYKTVREIIRTASSLSFETALEAGKEALAKQIDNSSCFAVLKLSEELNLFTVRDQALQHICTNFAKLCKEKAFRELSFLHMAKLCANDDLNAPTEELVFECIMSWVKHKVKERYPLRPNLLQLVRLPFLKEDYYYSKRVLPVFREHHCGHIVREEHVVRHKPRNAQNWILLMISEQWVNNNSAQLYVVKCNLRTGLSCNFTTFKKEDRSNFTALAVNGKLVIVGQKCQSKKLNDKACHEHLATMPTERFGFGVAELEGLIYAVGGCDTNCNILNTVERYDPETNMWTEVAAMPTARKNVALAAFGCHLYAIGGGDRENNCFRVVECYDPRTNQWTSRANLIIGRRWHGAAAFRGNIYAVGGLIDIFGGNTVTNTVERYSAIDDKWTQICSLTYPGHGIGCMVMGDRLLSLSSPTGIIEEYEYFQNSWVCVARRGDNFLRDVKCQRMVAVTMFDVKQINDV